MSKRYYQSKEKVTQKMTRDGLVHVNAVTGEETRISQRGQDFNLQHGKEDSVGRKSGQQAHSKHGRQSPPPMAAKQPTDYRQEMQIPQNMCDPDTPHVTQNTQTDETQLQEIPPNNPTLLHTADIPYNPAPIQFAPLSSYANMLHKRCVDEPVQTATPPPSVQRRLQHDESQPRAPKRAKPKQHGTRYQQEFATQDKPPVTDAPPPKPEHTDKLRFSKDEQPPTEGTPTDKKLNRLKRKAEKTDSKLKKSRDKLPHEKKAKTQRTFDDDKGKVKRGLKFEKEVLPKGFQKPTPKPVQAAKVMDLKVKQAIAGKFHQKIYEVEHENVSIKAAHRVEQSGESVYRIGKRVTHSAYRFVKERPYRTVAKLEKQATKVHVQLAYQKSLQDNPKLKSNLLSRFAQKQKIKQQYAKAARESGKRAATTAKTAGSIIADATKSVAGFFSRHPAIASVIVLILLLMVFIMTMFSSCSNMATGLLSSVVGSSYTAKDKDIDDSELSYTEWETDLQLEINSAEDNYPGYNEYRYNVGDIGHNPFELMAFLTAVYQDFAYSDVVAILQAIFNEQYTLSFVDEVETRYRTNSDGEEEAYDWYILNINLESKPFTAVILPRMNAEQLEMYNLYMITKGNRQYLSNVFDVNWLPYVSSYYGYRVHPITGAKDYHKGIDIALPSGTEIKLGQDGRVTFAGYNGDYGYVVVIEDDKGLVSKYAHCNTLLVSDGQEVRKGDPIATVGSTGNSTGPHLHLEVIKNGQYLNPIYFAQTGDGGDGYILSSSYAAYEDSQISD